MILTHYFPLLYQDECSSGKELFTTITEYNDKEQKTIAKHLSRYPGRALRRFDQFDDYIHRRHQTEKWLYSTFLAIGGEPVSFHPFYFILGKSEQLKADFGKGANELLLDTEQIDMRSVSFTLGDSIGIYFSSAPKRLYSLKEIETISSDVAFIQDQMIPLKLYHRYIEAQLWDKHYLEKATIIADYLPLVYIVFREISTINIVSFLN